MRLFLCDEQGSERSLYVYIFPDRRTQWSTLKVQSCKLYNNKYVMASTKIANNEIFTLIAVLVFKLLSRKVLFINRKDNRNC